MKQLISRLFRRNPSPETSPVITQREKEISSILSELENRKVVLDLKLEAHSPVYQAVVREIDINSSSLIIEDIFPVIPANLMRKGRAIELAKQSDGLNITLQSQFLETLNIDDEIAYKIQFPDKITKQQRRNAFRVALQRIANVKVVSNGPGTNRLFGMAENLSHSGIKLRLTGQVTEKGLATTNILDRCHIRLSSTEEIECDVEICNLRTVQGSNQHTIIGGKLKNMSSLDQLKLSRFLNNIQRSQTDD